MDIPKELVQLIIERYEKENQIMYVKIEDFEYLYELFSSNREAFINPDEVEELLNSILAYNGFE